LALSFEPQQLSFDQQQLSMFDRLQFSWLMLIPIEVKLYVPGLAQQVVNLSTATNITALLMEKCFIRATAKSAA